MRPIQRALLSVSERAGITEMARRLRRWQVELIATEGTAKLLRGEGLSVTAVSDLTGFPEVLGGRVKTLHPAIFAGILARRDLPEHLRDLEKHGLHPIDLVAVNLYPFRETIAREGISLEQAVEEIDIGGVTLIRAAAKNFADVAVVVDPADYPWLAEEMDRHHGAISAETRFALARKAFAHTSRYDRWIARYLAAHAVPGEDFNAPLRYPATKRSEDFNAPLRYPATNRSEDFNAPLRYPATNGGEDLNAPLGDHAAEGKAERFPPALELVWHKAADLRYGENPHQRAALYRELNPSRSSLLHACQLQGKDLSFNNLLDLDAALQILHAFREPAVVIVKHNNPCGVALGRDSREAFVRAREADPTSAFGGVVGCNRELDVEAAREIASHFLEVVLAPSVSPPALEILGGKPNLRVLTLPALGGALAPPSEGAFPFDLRQISGGLLLQERDDPTDDEGSGWAVVTRRTPTPDERLALQFAWKVAAHVRSNAVVFAAKDRTLGIGAGQMSRVDSVKLAVTKACQPLRGSALASDGFFPFRDGVEEAARAGATAIIQPGGSVRDAEVIVAADELDLAMVITRRRHFRH